MLSKPFTNSSDSSLNLLDIIEKGNYHHTELPRKNKVTSLAAENYCPESDKKRDDLKPSLINSTVDYATPIDLPLNTQESDYETLSKALEEHFPNVCFENKNCPRCSFSGKSIQQTKSHFISSHTNIRFKCPAGCSKRLLNSESIIDHIKDVEKGEIEHSDERYNARIRKGFNDESNIEVLECDGKKKSFEDMIPTVIQKISDVIRKIEKSNIKVKGLTIGYCGKFANGREGDYYENRDYIRRSSTIPNIKTSEVILGKFKTYQMANSFESFLIIELQDPSSELGRKFGELCQNVFANRPGPCPQKEGIGLVYFALFKKKKDRISRPSKI